MLLRDDLRHDEPRMAMKRVVFTNGRPEQMFGPYLQVLTRPFKQNIWIDRHDVDCDAVATVTVAATTCIGSIR